MCCTCRCCCSVLEELYAFCEFESSIEQCDVACAFLGSFHQDFLQVITVAQLLEPPHLAIYPLCPSFQLRKRLEVQAAEESGAGNITPPSTREAWNASPKSFDQRNSVAGPAFLRDPRFNWDTVEKPVARSHVRAGSDLSTELQQQERKHSGADSLTGSPSRKGVAWEVSVSRAHLPSSLRADPKVIQFLRHMEDKIHQSEGSATMPRSPPASSVVRGSPVRGGQAADGHTRGLSPPKQIQVEKDREESVESEWIPAKQGKHNASALPPSHNLQRQSSSSSSTSSVKLQQGAHGSAFNVPGQRSKEEPSDRPQHAQPAHPANSYAAALKRKHSTSGATKKEKIQAPPADKRKASTVADESKKAEQPPTGRQEPTRTKAKPPALVLDSPIVAPAPESEAEIPATAPALQRGRSQSDDLLASTVRQEDVIATATLGRVTPTVPSEAPKSDSGGAPGSPGGDHHLLLQSYFSGKWVDYISEEEDLLVAEVSNFLP